MLAQIYLVINFYSRINEHKARLKYNTYTFGIKNGARR